MSAFNSPGRWDTVSYLAATILLLTGWMISIPEAHATNTPPTLTCTSAALQADAPAGMTIANVPNPPAALPATTGGVLEIGAGVITPNSPAECFVTGTVVTNPETSKTANFAALLPMTGWNGKFMFTGCALNCGTLDLPPTDDVLSKGYPVFVTDDGHLSTNIAWPISSPGVLDQDAVTDFGYRAVHTTIVDGKQLALAFFGAAKFSYSYYEGCSDGGREGLVEADRYPDDFDGWLAGDPYFDVGGQNIIISNVTAQLKYADGMLPLALFTVASNIVTNQCDSADGVTDGLIQNPALCHFNALTDLPACPGNVADNATCFTQHQMQALSTIVTGMTDRYGQVIHTGFPVSDMANPAAFGAELALWTGIGPPFTALPTNRTAAEPWGPTEAGAPIDWLINDAGIKYWAYLGEPSYDSQTTLGFTYASGGLGPIGFFHTVVPDSTVNTIYNAMAIASSDYPDQLSSLIHQKKKVILFHGYSDGFITPYTTIQYYEQLAALNGGYNNLDNNVRLFMVPGMYHCGGGPGPNNFGQAGTQPGTIDALHDATTALEEWVEHGAAPATFIATKFQNDVPGGTVLRTMPVCPFPIEAHYNGTGDVNEASSWSCPQTDASLLKPGIDGLEAGLYMPLYNGR